MRTGKNVYILGAGASAHTGAPVMNNFIEKARELVCDTALLEPEEILRFRQALLFRDRFRRAKDIMGFDLENIEDVFSLVDMGAELGFPEASEARSNLIYLIYKTLEKAAKITWDSSFSADNAYHLLAKHMYEKKDADGAVVTFNYDVSFEYAYYRWYTHNKASYGIDYIIGEDGFAADVKRKILKLHGSVNWITCEACNKVTVYNMEDYFDDLTRCLTNKKRPAKIENEPLAIFTQFCGCSKTCSKCRDANWAKEPLIIPPTWNKSNANTDLTLVWQAAQGEISKAERLIIIGYSMPVTDVYLPYLLMLGFSKNDPHKEIIVICNTEGGDSTEKRYQSVFRPYWEKKKLRFIRRPFNKESIDEIGIP